MIGGFLIFVGTNYMQETKIISPKSVNKIIVATDIAKKWLKHKKIAEKGVSKNSVRIISFRNREKTKKTR